jgi:DeoR family fructose operon transcriptional repressor
MLTQERQQEILKLIAQKGAVTVVELTDIFQASESTIRRDLAVLDEMGKLSRVHGGATALQSNHFMAKEAAVKKKEQLNTHEKAIIGRYAANLISDDDFIYMDAGTTTSKMLDYIQETKATFVTNGLLHARKLMAKGCKVIVLGGEMKRSTEAIIGSMAIENLKHFNFTKAFLGTNGISLEQGFTTVDVDEGVLKQTAIERSYIRYMLADHTKFDKYAAVTFGELNQCAVITDGGVNAKYRERMVLKEILG